MSLNLTTQNILNDIAGFQERIESARAKLVALPATAATWADRKKLKQQQQELLNDITHIKRLMRYAQEALTEMEA